MTAWKPITKRSPGLRRVLVTNNLKARDARGQMSHVWCVDGVHGCEKGDWRGPFLAFAGGCNSYQQITGLTHFAEIPA